MLTWARERGGGIRPSRPIRRAAVTRAAGASSERARNCVLTPDSSSPGGNYPPRVEDPTARPAKCSGSLNRPVLGHLCTIRPKNSGNGVASLASWTETTRSRSVGAARLVRPSRELGHRDRGGSMSTPWSDGGDTTGAVRRYRGAGDRLHTVRALCGCARCAPVTVGGESRCVPATRRRLHLRARQASQTFFLTAPEVAMADEGTGGHV